MNPFWPFTALPALQPKFTRQTRLQDLEARMSSFLSEKQASSTSCPKVLDNIKVAKSTVQRELATG
ncbi:MAG: hypothetical protein RIE06_21870 [Roseibium album]|uniref:Uncharacterized protein n=1 Tax=Roseibium album TaxID=311410 RepID=A0A0M7AX76_9HYPH|nr:MULTISPECIES: hypothetical protein [Stappiaceae]MBG6161138.1 hypothetical protein [Labrenzia sp. EL_195]MBG6177291.1 hypothetical protein [Labrenzia sp. EL_132]MBG6200808.1 hypothetical protein [Labrenzia sp. EL_13]MBG6205695.1 hypothetical protein [Labrenzia sp. EL_126]MBG6231912.1 hypothetical protein [Labrenzia sp. EL_208]MCR9060579.1 hypothetical protein [Paracoccaceae bacterium]